MTKKSDSILIFQYLIKVYRFYPSLEIWTISKTEGIEGVRYKLLNNHSSGDANNFWSVCSLEHCYLQYLPSVDEKKENRHPFRPRCLFKRIPTKSSNADAKIREKKKEPNKMLR